MTEQPTHPEYAVVKSISIKLLHVGMASDLQNRLGISQSAVWQRAMEYFYAAQNDQPQPTPES